MCIRDRQKAVAGATAGTAAMPDLQNTLAGQAINTLGGQNNPFVQAGNTAQSIATGAANPFNVGANGQVTPNTNTALGGLFQAQNQQLNQLLPTTIAPQQAGAISSGNFGSLRGQTSVDTAKANAQANMLAQQMQAALQNQSTGVNAAQQAGNLANQNITNQTSLGQLQQVDPTMRSATLAKILGGISAPQTITQSAQLSPLSQIGSISNLLGSTGAVNSLLNSLGVSGGITGLGKSIIGGLSGLNIGGGGGGNTAGGGIFGPTPGGGNIDGGGIFGPTPGGGNIDMGGGGIYVPPTFDNNPAPDWSATESYD